MSTCSEKEKDDFIRQYAAEIAKALREQEDVPKTPLVEESVKKLYRSLCFDEPVIEDAILANIATVVSALCRQLLNKSSSSSSSSYAISNRFINGIVHICQQHKQKRKDGDTHDDKQQSASIPSTLTTAMTKLAFCVLIQVPLECCQNIENLDIVRRYLGSYKGNEFVNGQQQQQQQKQTPSLTDIEEVELKSQQVVEAITKNDAAANAAATTPDNNNDDNNDNNNNDDNIGFEEEVWAAESDPSDFDYGESAPILSTTNIPVEEEDWLDPKFLSRPDPTLTIDGIKAAVVSILQYANFSILEPIFHLSKKELDKNNYLLQLTQLSLVLLQPHSPFFMNQQQQDQESQQPTSNSDVSAQSAILSPLWILRDAATSSSSSSSSSTLSSRTLATSSYLDLLQTLLAMDQAHMQDSSVSFTTTIATHNKQKSEPLCVASIVGLSALSSWCTTTGIDVALTNTAIVEAMNDLAHVVERACAAEYSKHNLTHTLVPMLESLTGITHDQVVVVVKTKSQSYRTQQTPQMLLNSGLMRQLLSIAISFLKEQEQEEPSVYYEHALWGLCVVYPTTIGKYSMRYPGFATLIRRYSGSPKSPSDCVHSILWNAFGYTQCNTNSNSSNSTTNNNNNDAPRVIWKSSSSAKPSSSSSLLSSSSPPLSKDECEEVCQKAWATLCRMVRDAAKSSTETPQDSLRVVQEWTRLRTLMMGVPSVFDNSSSLLSLLDRTPMEDISSTIQELSRLQPRQSSSSTSTTTTTVEEKTKDEEEEEGNNNNNNNDKPTEDGKKKVVDHHLVTAEIRKTLKQYTLLFEGTSSGSSKTD